MGKNIFDSEVDPSASTFWKSVLDNPGKYTITFECPLADGRVLGPWHSNREWPNEAGTPDGPCGICDIDHERELVREPRR